MTETAGGEPMYETARELTERTGKTDTVVCTDCGAFVMNVAAHDQFHSSLSAAVSAEPLSPEWTVCDLRDGTYGDFHRLAPADHCNDADCARSGEHV